MNREETKEAIEVMQAWLEGKDILIEERTLLVRKPDWNWSINNYSVRPEPIERWIALYDKTVNTNGYSTMHYDSEKACQIDCGHLQCFIKAIKLVEAV